MSQPTALHDLLWYFVGSLSTPSPDSDDGDDAQDPGAGDNPAAAQPKKDQRKDEVRVEIFTDIKAKWFFRR